MPPDNSWGEWSRHVLSELERLNACYEKMNDKLDKVNADIITLKVKSGAWGLIAGAIPVTIMILIKHFS